MSNDAFDGRNQVKGKSVAVDRQQLLALANPTFRLGDFDTIDFADQVCRECVETDADIFLSFTQNPRVSRMKAVIFGNVKTGLPGHERCRRMNWALLCCRQRLWWTE